MEGNTLKKSSEEEFKKYKGLFFLLGGKTDILFE